MNFISYHIQGTYSNENGLTNLPLNTQLVLLAYNEFEWFNVIGFLIHLSHYRSKTHFCNTNYPFQQKYVNFRIRNNVELMKKIFGQK